MVVLAHPILDEIGNSAADRSTARTSHRDRAFGAGQVMGAASPLRSALEFEISRAAALGEKRSLKDLTVLAVQNDPFRIDTSAAHRDGAWLANAITALGLSSREIHLRGLHYALIGVEKPNGSPYRNTDEDWRGLQEKAADAARWLGYINFEQITDQRNAAPIEVCWTLDGRRLLRNG